MWTPLPEAERLDAYYHHKSIFTSFDDNDQPFFTKRRQDDRVLITAASLGKQQRPKTAAVRAKKEKKKERPQSAPVRVFSKYVPVRVYADVNADEERGPPDLPRLSCFAKPGSVLGFHNVVLSDTDDDGRHIEFTGTVLVRLETSTPWATVRYRFCELDSWKIFRRDIEVSESTQLHARSSKRGSCSDEIIVKFVKRVDTVGVKERIRRASTVLAMKKVRNSSLFSLGRTPRERDRESLLVAIRDRNVIVVRKLLKAGVDDVEDDYALLEACNAGHVIIVSLLLAHGIKPTIAALCAACRANSPRCCRLLIQKGASIESQDLSPLHQACLVGASRCVDLLLKAGAAVDKPSPPSQGTTNGDLPLHTTCRSVVIRNEDEYARCVRLLVQAGAHVEAKAKNRRPIQLAHRANASVLVQTLLDVGAKPLVLKQPKTMASKTTKRRR